jgi:NAD+ kinase
MSKSVGIIAAFSKPEASELAVRIKAHLESLGCSVVPERALTDENPQELLAIIVLGGDGLMMRAANMYPDIPLFGINFGKVGFLAMVEQRDWLIAINALLAGLYTVQDGATLAATVLREPNALDQGWAINDVVIRGGVRMIDIEVYIDSHYVNTYPGDGMIISTPRGSTAYCMAAGGPILTAGVQGFAIVPISCHSPIRTPFIVAESALIELVVATKHEASLILDGRQTAELSEQDAVRIQRGAHQFRLLTLDSMDFYEAFRTKFNFKIRPDAVPSRLNIPAGS